MRVLALALVAALMALALAAPALAQDQDRGQTVQADQGKKAVRPLERLVEKVEALAAPIVALGILTGALALMVAPQKGKAMLGFVLLAGLLLLGGWRWLLELLRYALSP